MSALQLIALASTASLLAGWRLYLVTFAVGLAMKFGWVALPGQLHSLDILANNWLIGIAGAGALAEFFADKIAWVDSLWDAVHSVVRPLGVRYCLWRSSMAATQSGRSRASSWAAGLRSSRMPARQVLGPS